MRLALILIAIGSITYGITELVSLYRAARRRDHLGHELNDEQYQLNPHEWRVRRAMLEREAQNRENL